MPDILKFINDLYNTKGKKPTDSSVQSVYTIANALKLESNDPFIQIIILLEFYFGLYKTMPAEIESASKIASSAAVKVAESQVKALTAKIETDLAQAVALAAQKSAKAASTKKMIIWICSSIIFLVIILIFCCGFSYYYGEKNGITVGKSQGIEEGISEGRRIGLEEGLATLHNKQELESELLKFSKSKAFSKVVKMYENGDLVDIVYCRRPGWKIEKGWCYPKETQDGIFGWKIPN